MRLALGTPLMVLLAVARSFAAQPPPLELHWEAPPECPQQAVVEQRMQALLASLEGKLKPSRLRAEGLVEPVGDRFRLTLVVHDGPAVGTRIIESDSCDDLAGAAAVALGLLVRVEQSSTGPLPEGALGGQPEETSPPPAPVMPPPPPPPKPPEPVPQPTPRRWHPLLRVPELAIDAGVLPRPSYGAGLAVGIGYETWRVLVGGFLWWRQSVPAAGFPGFRADIDRARGDLEACRGWRVSRFEIAPCVILSLDGLSARGRGPGLISSQRRLLWLSPGAGLEGAWRFSEFASLVVSVNGRVSTSRPRLVIDNIGEVHRVPPLAGGTTVACEWIF